MIPSTFSTNFSSNKAVIYTRVSSEEQVENFSLGTQEEFCKRDESIKDMKLPKFFEKKANPQKQ